MFKADSILNRITAGITLSIFCAFFFIAALHKDPPTTDPDQRITFYSLDTPQKPDHQVRTRLAWHGASRLSSGDFECPLCFWNSFSKTCPQSSGLLLEAGEIAGRCDDLVWSIDSIWFLSSTSARGPPGA